MHRTRPRSSALAPRPHRSGATTVEFALTMPIAFLLLMASVEFARVNMIRNTLVNAAYTGARRAMVPGATADVTKTEAKKVLSLTGIKGGTVTVEPNVLTNTTSQVTVTVTVPLNQNSWVAPTFMKENQYSRTCTLSREMAKR